MIALASDHGGFEMKEDIKKLLDELNAGYQDFGTYTAESCDYPRYGYLAAKAVAEGACDKGIIVCGTGLGISFAANKVKGIRAAVCSDCFTAVLSRQHNDANMLALGARVVGPGLARLIVKMWLETAFEGGERHQRRVDQIGKIETGILDFL
jgi:ribose 5-phosphate isomerase B